MLIAAAGGVFVTASRSTPAQAAIDRDFGAPEGPKAKFSNACTGQFGSGWVMVLVDRAGALCLVTRVNQHSPLMDGKTVLFGNDVGKHAYYLKRQNRRADYPAAWWNVVKLPVVERRDAAAMAGTLVV